MKRAFERAGVGESGILIWDKFNTCVLKDSVIKVITLEGLYRFPLI